MSVLSGCVSLGWDSHIRGQIRAFRSAWLGCFRLKLTVFKMHIICAHDFYWVRGAIRNIRQTYENDRVTKKITKILKFFFWNFENLFNFFKYLFPWELLTRWLSLIFLKMHRVRDLEDLIHPSWRSFRSDLIGDKVFVERSERKTSHPRNNLTSNHTFYTLK